MTYSLSESPPAEDLQQQRVYAFDDEFRRFNWTLIAIEVAIFVIGLLNLYSATKVEDKSLGLYKTQLMWFAIGSCMTVAAVFFHYSFLSRLGYGVYFFNLLLLVLVLLVGKQVLGARRWIGIGGFTIQPSEFMKLSVAILLAKYFESDKNLGGGYRIKDLLLPSLLVGIPAGLIILQPDLGTAMIVLLVYASVMLFLGIHRKTLLIILTCVMIAVPVAYKFALKPYQRQRIVTFLDPASDPKGAGYNSIQSMIAIGSGQLWGKGWTKGTQSQYNFLPEHHTDFIFSVYSEEWGFFGSIVLIGLYLALLFNGVSIIQHSNDKFAMVLAFGICSIFFWHIVINMLMVMGMLPIVGVPLPFMSYGGSSLLTSMAGIAILVNIANKKFMF